MQSWRAPVSSGERSVWQSYNLSSRCPWRLRRPVSGTAVDLLFGSNPQPGAIAEIYGCDDGVGVFVRDFAAAWDKVANLDHFVISR